MNQMSKQGASHRPGEDYISSLPDHLLTHILSSFPTKKVVTTSIVSPRWKNLWLSTPVLDIDIDDFHSLDDFVRFTSRFLDFHKHSCLHKFKISFEERFPMRKIMYWLELGAVKRKIQHLEIHCRLDQVVESNSVRLYLSENLVSLRLRFVWVGYFEFVSLPNLKVMHLEETMFDYNKTLGDLISSCPVLEDLTVARILDDTNLHAVRVCSRSLKSLKLVIDSFKTSDIEDINEWKIFIDAPGLTYLSIKDDFSVSIVISNLSSSTEVDIDVGFNVSNFWNLHDSYERSAVAELLTGLSSVSDLTISGETLKILCHYLKLEQRPQFHNMTQLHTKFYICDLEMLPTVLECCPNLKTLVVDMHKFTTVKENEEISFSSSVPKCLQTSLEEVEIIRSRNGDGAEMRVSKYILENSVNLKTFTIYVDCPKEGQGKIKFMELQTFKRRSRACAVNFWVYDHDEV